MTDSATAERRPAHWKPTAHNPARCKWAREQAELTLTQAAARLGISPGYLSELESGTRSAGIARQRDMAELYGQPVRELGAVIDGRNVHDKPE